MRLTQLLDHRKAGTPDWKYEKPLFRVEKGANRLDRGEGRVKFPADARLLAGSAVRLEPGTDYRLRLTPRDPGGGNPERVLQARVAAESVARADAPQYDVRISRFEPEWLSNKIGSQKQICACFFWKGARRLAKSVRSSTFEVMKLPIKLEKALNEQINLEFSSAYAYLGMAAYFEHTAFEGFAKWMRVQSDEELEHARKFFNYIVERNGRIVLKGLPEPKLDFKSPLESFQASLAHEQRVSAAICGLYELAHNEKDYPTLSFLKWFLDEQVEEEKTVTDFIAKLELVGENHNGLYQIDKLAGRRGEEAK
jgi:ferritin